MLAFGGGSEKAGEAMPMKKAAITNAMSPEKDWF
jgi:hypothetical protein